MPPTTMRSYDDHHGDSKSAASHKSTQSSRSSVLERARAYNRRVDEENERRAKSVERQSSAGSQYAPISPRSQSAGRPIGSRPATRERAMASVRNISVDNDTSYNQSRNNESYQTARSQHSTMSPRKQQHQRPDPIPRNSPKAAPLRKPREEPQEAVVSPELLVDALSGHEDGLLAIAERLMEHYDQGYDVMGEAIIDAFADVQKLFQHVVEAAHMEGAAFEASRREVEITELRKRAANNADVGEIPISPASNGRHDEFIDQDVKDILTEAINQGAALRDAGKHMDCYVLYENSCQNASSLLPVDSDHRGRLQLSIARAESMSPDRACAILRYAMDDVMRSGLRANKAPLPDISKRSDMVLSKPRGLPSMTGEQAGVVQSSEEALASLVEELKEVMSAPVYDNTPLQSVAQRFWVALGEAQRSQLKNEERLEQSLAKLKGEFLLARAEWEEKLTATRSEADQFKKKYMLQKDTHKGEVYMDQARSVSSKWNQERREEDVNLSYDSINKSRANGSVVSIGSALGQSARQIVGSFNCAGANERSDQVMNSDDTDVVPSTSFSTHSSRESRPPPGGLNRGRSNTKRNVKAGSAQHPASRQQKY